MNSVLLYLTFRDFNQLEKEDAHHNCLRQNIAYAEKDNIGNKIVH
jgi:hypothetical protein